MLLGAISALVLVGGGVAFMCQVTSVAGAARCEVAILSGVEALVSVVSAGVPPASLVWGVVHFRLAGELLAVMSSAPLWSCGGGA